MKVGMRIEDLTTPALLLDKAAMERNLHRMATFFAGRPAQLRPHFKNHKCTTLARRQMAAGSAVGMTCAKLAEAEVLVDAGIDNVLIANQVVGAGKLERLARIAPSMQSAADEAQGLLEQLSDLARTIQDYADQLEFNPERLQEVEERLEMIHGLKRKYGDTIEQIIAFGAHAQSELDDLANWEVKTAELEAQEDDLLHAIGDRAAKLSAQRAAAGERLARQVETELADLRMASPYSSTPAPTGRFSPTVAASPSTTPASMKWNF